jgi:hypothetical protein
LIHWILDRLGVSGEELILPPHTIRLNVARETAVIQGKASMTIPYETIIGNSEARMFALSWMRHAIGNNIKVVITCGAGLNRSTTVAMLYLIYVGMNKDEAYGCLKNGHEFALPYLNDIDKVMISGGETKWWGD